MDKANALKKRLQRQHKAGLALDIDNTLSQTNLWWAQRLHEKHGSPEGLSPKQAIEKYGLSSNVPYWKNSADAQKWMEEQRHSNQTQEEYEVLEEAKEAVLEINKIIPIQCYLTARPDSVENGTKKWLEKHGFPKAEVIMRPGKMPHAGGNSWKAKTLESLYPEIIGLIDDDPDILAKLSTSYKGKIFLLNSKFTTSSKNVFACKSWKEALAQVKRQLP